MKEENKEKKLSTPEKFFQTLTTITIGQMGRVNFYNSNALQKIYSSAKESIERNISDPLLQLEFYQILDRFYKLIDEKRDIRDDIVSKKMKKEDFVDLYKDIVLGTSKRKYNMSDLFNESFITMDTDRQTGEKFRKVRYVGMKIRPKYEFIDSNGQKIVIQKIGELFSEQWNGLEPRLPKYIIERYAEGNIPITDEIYSYIDFNKMNEEEYREAVLKELLSDNNIKLSKAGGYVGEIVYTPTDLQGKEQKEINSGKAEYYYKINERYSLMYDGAMVSAAMLYDKISKEKNYDEILQNFLNTSEKGDKEQR